MVLRVLSERHIIKLTRSLGYCQNSRVASFLLLKVSTRLHRVPLTLFLSPSLSHSLTHLLTHSLTHSLTTALYLFPIYMPTTGVTACVRVNDCHFISSEWEIRRAGTCIQCPIRTTGFAPRSNGTCYKWQIVCTFLLTQQSSLRHWTTASTRGLRNMWRIRMGV